MQQFLKQYKRMPSRKEFLDKIYAINRDMYNELVSQTQSEYRKLYNLVASKESVVLGVPYKIKAIDQTAVNYLSTRPQLLNAYAGLSQKIAQRFEQVFMKEYQSYSGINRKRIAQKIQEIAQLSDSRAETIARTESAKISAGARRIQYIKIDPEGTQYKYYHIGPNDSRTTDTSKRIKERTQGGVSWDEYVRIVTEESAKDFPTWRVDPASPVAFWNSRHTFIARKGQSI